MRILVIAMVSITLLLSCGGKKELLTASTLEPEKPSWLVERPVSSLYYIGIGRALKRGAVDEYHAIARKNALSEMASEIEVKVSSNSLLNTLEDNGSFSERFDQDIFTSTELELEGFEAWDSWEGNDEYWVYYRLEKSTYARIKAERKRAAIRDAASILELAELSRAERDIRQSAKLYVQSIDALQGYWGEYNPPIDDPSGESLDKLAYERLLSLINGVEIVSQVSSIELNEANAYRQELEVSCYLDGGLAKPVEWITRLGRGEKNTRQGSSIIKRFRPSLDSPVLYAVEVDPFESLRKTYRDPSYRFIKDLLSPYVLQLDVVTSYPLLGLRCTGETEQVDCATVEAGLAKLMMSYGLRSGSDTPYHLAYQVDFRDGGESQGFIVQFADLSIQAIDERNGAVAHVLRFNEVKGVHADVRQARLKALEKALSNVQEKDLKALLDGLF